MPTNDIVYTYPYYAIVEDGRVVEVVPNLAEGLPLRERFSAVMLSKMVPAWSGVTPGMLWDGHQFHTPGQAVPRAA